MIWGYTGLIGHGKTMLAVDDAVRTARARGAILAANIKVTAPGVEFEQLTVGEDGLSIEQMEGLMDRARATGRGVVILIDEIGIIMPARFWQTFPVRLMFRLSQSRKYRTDVVWTSQDVEDVDAYLRRKSQWVYTVRAVPSPTTRQRERQRRPWLFILDQWPALHVRKEGKRVARLFMRYRREREGVYDTDELVLPPARVQERDDRMGRRSRARRTGPSLAAPSASADGPNVTKTAPPSDGVSNSG